MHNVIVFGASGHGRVILDCLEKAGLYQMIGFVDSFKQKGQKINGYPILGDEYDLPHLILENNIEGGIVAIGDNWQRSCMVNRIKDICPEFNFVSIVHPNAIVSDNVKIGIGSVLMPGVIVNTNAVIKDFCILNTNSSLDHDGCMENFSSLAPNVTTGGNVFLGEYSIIGIGSNVLENVSIEEHSVIGGNSLVNRDISNFVIAYGTPARVKRNRYMGEPYLKSGTSTNC